MFISNFYGFLLGEFGMQSHRAGFSATAELSCLYLTVNISKTVADTAKVTTND